MLLLLLSALHAPAEYCDQPSAATDASGGTPSPTPPAAPTAEKGSDTGYYAVDVCREMDPGGQQLTGIRFSAGGVDVPGSGNDVHAETSATLLVGDGQHTYRANLGVGLTLFAVKGLLVVPRFGSGIEYRTSAPDAGWAGVFGVGVEISAWIKKKAELAFLVDRNFGFPSGTRNQYGVAVRRGGKRLPWWPRKNMKQTPEGAAQAR